MKCCSCQRPVKDDDDVTCGRCADQEVRDAREEGFASGAREANDENASSLGERIRDFAERKRVMGQLSDAAHRELMELAREEGAAA